MLNSSFCLIGEGTLLIRCAELLLTRRQEIIAVITHDRAVTEWCQKQKIVCFASFDNLIRCKNISSFNYLISVAHKEKLSGRFLAFADKLCINYHNSCLPGYAGCHATSWAIYNLEEWHGVTWHVMNSKIDSGDILQQIRIRVAPEETTLSLNLKCYEKALIGFKRLISLLVDGDKTLLLTPQDLTQRSYYSATKKFPGNGLIDWNNSAKKIDAMFRALSFGFTDNPVGVIKFKLNGIFYVVKKMSVDKESSALPGTIVNISNDGFYIATKTSDIVVRDICFLDGVSVDFNDFVKKNKSKIGEKVDFINPDDFLQYQKVSEKLSQFEAFWVSRLVFFGKNKKPDFIASNSTTKDFYVAEDFVITEEIFQNSFDKQSLIALASLLFLNRIGFYCEVVAVSEAATLKNSQDDLFSHYTPFNLNFSPNGSFSSLLKSFDTCRRDASIHPGFIKDIFIRYRTLKSVFPPFIGIVFGHASIKNFDFPVAVLVNKSKATFSLDRSRIKPELIKNFSDLSCEFFSIFNALKKSVSRNQSVNFSLFSNEEKKYLTGQVNKEKMIFNQKSDKIKKSTFLEILKKIFPLVDVNFSDNFFLLGGDSISATRLVSGLREKNLGLSLRDIFENPTIGEIFLCIKLLDDFQTNGLTQYTNDNEDNGYFDTSTFPRIESDNMLLSDAFPLLPVQEGMVFQSLRYANSGVYFVQAHGNMQGIINISLMRRAWEVVFRRHDAFRIKFEQINGKLFQKFSQQDQKIPWYYYDWRGTSILSDRLKEFLTNDSKAGFCLSDPPLVRLTLIRVSERKYRFVLSFHHAIMDGWSIPLLLSEIDACYRYGSGNLPDVRPCRYLFNNLLKEKQTDNLLFWKNYLKDVRGPTEFSYFFKRSSKACEIESKATSFSLSREDSFAICSLSKLHGYTLNSIFQSLWAFLLSFYSQKEEVIFGTALSIRPLDASSNEVVGPFINTLPLRVVLNHSMSFLDLINLVQENLSLVIEHANSALVEIKNAVKDFSGEELFKTMLIFENYPSKLSDNCIFNSNSIVINDPSHYPLTAYVFPEKKFKVKLNYNRSMVNENFIYDIRDHFSSLIRQIIKNSEIKLKDVSFLSYKESRKLLMLSQGEPNPGCNFLPYQYVEFYAQKTPKKTALLFNNQKVSYQELNRKANQLAHYLLELGVNSIQIIAIWMDNTISSVVSILAILKLGCAYMPIDSDCPEERIFLMLRDSAVNYLISSRKLLCRLSKSFPDLSVVDIDSWLKQSDLFLDSNLDRLIAANQLMYVIYTSGSTGKPKGVMIEHRNVSSLLFGVSKRLSFSQKDVWTMFHSIAFDFSVWEIWGALTSGASLVIVPKIVARATDEFYDLLLKHDVTMLSQTPSAFYRLVIVDKTKNSSLKNLRYIVFDGEILQPEVVNLWFDFYPEDKPTLVNMYGITEATVHLTSCEIKKGNLVDGVRYPIGRGFPGVNLYILDKHRQLLPPGFSGELYVGGDFLSRGYIDQALSAQRFFDITLPNGVRERVYKTGDLARFLMNGEIDYLGRIDNQVKFRGFRLELDEISAWLLKHPNVTNAVTLLHKFSDSHKVIVCYYTSNNNQEIEKSQLLKHLASYLPNYMLPGFFIHVNEFLLNNNGKIDRSALPSVEKVYSGSIGNQVNSQQEVRLLAVWREVLKINSISVDDDFFEIGGNSILALQVLSRSQEIFSVNFPISFLFEFPTISGFVANMSRYFEPGFKKKEKILWTVESCLIPLKADGHQSPLFLVHPVGGSIFWYILLARRFDCDRPLYGIQDPGLASLDNIPFDSVEEMASFYIEKIREIQPTGPYYLGGASGGSVIGFEMARQLLAAGNLVDFLGLLDGWAVHSRKLRCPEIFDSIMRRQFYELKEQFAAIDISNPESLFSLQRQRLQLLDKYCFSKLDLVLTLFKATETIPVYKPYEDDFNCWSSCSSLPVERYYVSGDHETMFQQPHVTVLINQLNLCLNRKASSVRGVCETTCVKNPV